MAAILGDLLQLVDNQSYLGQQVLNVYYYRVTAPLGIADPYLSDLNDYWEEHVLSDITQIQIDQCVHNSREWRNISNGVDLFTNSTVVPGGQAISGTLANPSFMSMGFLLQRTSLSTRNGYKRFAGVPESWVAGNEYTGPTDLVDNVAFALAADLNIGLLSVAEPVIVKRPIVVPVASYLYSSIDQATFRGIGTQNSRKKGRGV